MAVHWTLTSVCLATQTRGPSEKDCSCKKQILHIKNIYLNCRQTYRLDWK